MIMSRMGINVRLLHLLFAGVLTCGAAAAAPQEKPRQDEGIAAERTSHDFGEIPQGEVRTAEFPLTAADDVVVLLSASTNCECTTASYPRKPLRRGEKGIITVRYEARDKGYFRKIVTLRYTAGGKTRSLQLSVAGTVI